MRNAQSGGAQKDTAAVDSYHIFQSKEKVAQERPQHSHEETATSAGPGAAGGGGGGGGGGVEIARSEPPTEEVAGRLAMIVFSFF